MIYEILQNLKNNNVPISYNPQQPYTKSISSHKSQCIHLIN